MKTELILKSDVLDIIFENRNKAYGAYYLRKFYSSRLTKSLGLMMAGVIVLSAFTFIPNMKSKKGVELIFASDYDMKKLEKKPPEPEKPKEQVVQQKQKSASVQFNQPKIVPSYVDVPPITAITDTTRIANITVEGPANVDPVIGDPGDGTDIGKGKDPVTEPKIDANTPIFTAEVMPEYPGGMSALRRFLEKNLSNPRDLEENETVSVKVRFVVGFDGKLKSFETIEDGGEEFNKEVIRVLKRMPEWIPGKTRGQSVSVYYTIPVKFVPAN